MTNQAVLEPLATEVIQPPRSLVTAAGRAIGDFDMIRDGDRILLGLSGGKDSLSLLHVLLHLQKKAPIKFELAACTVDPQSDQFDPSPLKPYLAELGVKYFFDSQPIVAEAQKNADQGYRLFLRLLLKNAARHFVSRRTRERL